jgi:hypothetical protein
MSAAPSDDRERTVADHEPCEATIFELRHQVLIATDRALGAEAELERLQDTLAAQRAQVEQATKAEQKARKEREALAKEVVAIHQSQTWRAGRLIVGPIARLRRRGAKRA